jgi:hypothetical protein
MNKFISDIIHKLIITLRAKFNLININLFEHCFSNWENSSGFNVHIFFGIRYKRKKVLTRKKSP